MTKYKVKLFTEAEVEARSKEEAVSRVKTKLWERMLSISGLDALKTEVEKV